MNENQPGSWKKIAGCIVLIAVLFAGVRLAFWGLGQAIPQNREEAGTSASQSGPEDGQKDREAPSFCIHCGKGLPDSFEWGQFCPWCGAKNENG